MGGWRVLTPADAKGRPTLLTKDEFKSTEYRVYVTDLASIWEECLDRRSIIKRALQDDTSIDPSEGSDQLKLLLERIQAALAGEPDTSRQVLPSKDESTLHIQLRAGLPAPLESLVWSMTLKQTAGDVLFRQLFLPAFEQTLQTQRRLQSLLKQVKEKDHVIQRLSDKLESSGIELANVFPGAQAARGSKATARETLSRAVPGLRTFDEMQWYKMTELTDVADSSALFEEVLADLGNSDPTSQWKTPGRWWDKIPASGHNLDVNHKSATENSAPSHPASSKRKHEENDDFQLQDTSGLQDRRASNPKVLVEDSQPRLLESVADRMSTTDDGEGSEAEASVRDDRLASSEIPTSPQASSAVVSASKRIGMLGKQKRAAAPSQSPVPESVPEEKLTRTCTPPGDDARRKVGRIGGSRRPHGDIEMGNVPIREVQSSLDDKVMPVPAPTAAESLKQNEHTHETEEEKAERRRAELKVQMEASKKAQPKKKRKF